MSSTALLLLCLFSVCTFAWKPLKVGSWNTMLQPWFLWADDVYDHIPADLEVLALQEVWTTEQRDAILEKTQHTYPFHYWPQEYNEHVGCNMTDLTLAYMASQYVNCLLTEGIDTQTLQQPLTPVPLQCMQWAFGIALHNLDPHNQLCLACLINGLEYLPHEEAASVFQTCGAGVGPKYGHKGVNGQLILSQYPIEDVSEHRFDAFVANRVNIHATINGIKFGFGHFAFNLLADASPTYAPFMYGALQTNHVEDFVAAGVDVIVGDMNSGPNYQPDGFNLLFASGYKQVTLDQPSWCDTEHASFTPCINAGAIPMPIDHIFIKNTSSVIAWHAETFNEKPIMSDHIGVSVWMYDCWWCFWN